MKEKEIKQMVEIPEGVEVKIEGREVAAKGQKGEAKRVIGTPRISVEKEGNQIILKSLNATKREKTLLGTYKAHIANLVKGVSEGFVYKLKICSGHFPMNVSVSKEEVVVGNFLGEKIPRTVKLKEGVTAKMEGEIITIESADKELAGQTAADIEQLTRITNRDLRIFQDGIYIIDKCGKKMN